MERLDTDPSGLDDWLIKSLTEINHKLCPYRRFDLAVFTLVIDRPNVIDQRPSVTVPHSNRRVAIPRCVLVPFLQNVQNRPGFVPLIVEPPGVEARC